jgi:glycosyltransferase involved in cell wall biosynthesis
MLADGLARRGIPVTVYGPAATWAAAARVVAGVSAESRDGPDLPEFAAVEIAARPRPSRDLAAIRRLRALISRDRPDVVHAHGLRAGALAALAVGRSTASRPRLVVTIHNAAPSRGPAAAVYRVLERIVAARADTVLCVSGDLEARMRGLGSRNVAPAVVAAPVTPPRVPAETLAAVRAEFGAGGTPDRTPDRTPVILTVARLAPQKGLGTLIGAAARWRDRSPVPLLVIAGAGPLAASLSAQAEASGARVRLAGQRDDVPALLAAADVVVVPSVWEGQPLIVQEALRAGRPLVASRAGGIAALTGEDAALLVPPGDDAALAAAVITVLDDPALAARLSAAAARRAMALPSERDAVDAAMAAYQRVPPG